VNEQNFGGPSQPKGFQRKSNPMANKIKSKISLFLKNLVKKRRGFKSFTVKQKLLHNLMNSLKKSKLYRPLSHSENWRS
jgi:hypothetical protein